MQCRTLGVRLRVCRVHPCLSGDGKALVIANSPVQGSAHERFPSLLNRFQVRLFSSFSHIPVHESPFFLPPSILPIASSIGVE
eukprot:780124-Rhodomonas_salina.1